MPDLRSLNALKRRVREAMRLTTGSHGAGWAQRGDPMHLALKDVKNTFGGEDDATRPARDDMMVAVRKFLRQKQVESFTQLKYVCYGVTVPIDDDGARLIDSSDLFRLLLELVQSRQGQAKQFRRCYQGLLAAYFGFDQHIVAAAGAQKNWQELRGFLKDRLEPIADAARLRGRAHEWLEVLEQHRNLLADKPCERYALALRAGDRSELEGVCAGLNISPTSWVWHEAVMAYVTEVVRAEDAPFQAELPQVLLMVDGDGKQHHLPELVARNAVALCVARYARCAEKPEQPALRDVCLRRIGNPWLKRPAWDASVNSEPARKMVESWLKRRLIKDFFELLAQDGAADLRRLNYWLKWEPQISDMWFVLGLSARSIKTSAFMSLRQRMKGRERFLTGTTTDNNAFVMRIGDHLVVEFGVTGNACFAFPASDSRLSLEGSDLTIYDLKHQPGRTKLSHSGDWEWKFNNALRELLRQAAPAKSPPQATYAVAKGSTLDGPSAHGSAYGASPPPNNYLDSRYKPHDPIDLAPNHPLRTTPPVDRGTGDTPNREANRASTQPASQAPNPDAGRYRPAFTPPSDAAPVSRHVVQAGNTESQDLPENPVRMSPTVHELLKIRCKRYGVHFEEATSSRPRWWIHLTNLESALAIAELARSIGFAHVPGKGFYGDRPILPLANDARTTNAQGTKLNAIDGPVDPAIQVKPAVPSAQTGQLPEPVHLGGVDPPINPVKMSPMVHEALKLRCKRYGVTFQEATLNRPRWWVHLKNPDSAPGVAELARSIGFVHVPARGYYADQTGATDSAIARNSPDQAIKSTATVGAADQSTHDKQIELLKRLCNVEGVAYIDNRPKGGAFWVRMLETSASTSLVSLLKRMNFKYASGKGYYLSGND